MNRNKRQGNILTNDCEDNKKKKFQSLVTNFEDLSNELMCDIFELLDGYDLYQIFFNLNQRFRNLCLYSSFLININILSLSKSIFENYLICFIEPNKHRINSIYLSESFPIEYFSSFTKDISKYFQLQSLILPNIELKDLQNLLDNLISLSNLSSLSIHINSNSNKTEIYRFIFQLSTLKFCKISFEGLTHFLSLPLSTNSSSSIESLSINSKFDYIQMDALLSYVPKLRYLSIANVYGYLNDPNRVLSSVPKYLTHVSLTLHGLKFLQFQLWIKQYFNQVKILEISSSGDNGYLDANQWKKLIVEHMPYLHIFDFQYTYQILDHRVKHEYLYNHLFQEFISSFWSERQWFFAYDYNLNTGLFYSIQLYRKTFDSMKNYCFFFRRKSYRLTSNSSIMDKKILFNSVNHLIIPDEKLVSNCSKIFPKIQELTISDQRIDRARRSENDNINHFIPLAQLTKLTINYKHRPFSKVIDLLSSTSNLHTLILEHVSLISTDYFSFEQNEKFRFNQIKQLIISYEYSLRDIQLFRNLFPLLQQISIGISENSLQPTIEFLLEETKKLTCHLFLISIFGIDENIIKKLTNLIELDNYSIKNIDKIFYIWC